MLEHDCGSLVFSSSATVYGEPALVPVEECFPTGGCTNPYGFSKHFIEQVLRDVARSNPDFHVCLLRYFNPVGAHPSGRIGEDPKGIPNNLMPYIQQVAADMFFSYHFFSPSPLPPLARIPLSIPPR